MPVDVALSEPLEPADGVLEGDEPVVAGEGDTIETGAVELDDDEGVVDVDEDAVVLVAADDVDDAGLVLSLGTPLANGSRAMPASTTLTGSVADVVAVVVV
ncbi:MAG: hypothetical protein ACRDPM_23490 [Solirubrobacteraceae bacterium]